MLSDEVRSRLANLHAVEPSNAAPRAGRVASPVQVQSAAHVQQPRFDPVAMEQGEECENPSGTHLRFRQPVTQLWPQADRAIGDVATSAFETAGTVPILRSPRSRAPWVTLPREPWSGLSPSLGVETTCDRGGVPPATMHPELAALAGSFPEGALFLDLETCGFAGSTVFLAGLIWHDGSLVLEQLFARTYAEERALLDSLWQIAAQNRVLVTFNGKSFDWPMVHDRSTRHHLGRDGRRPRRGTASERQAGIRLSRDDFRPELVHCDLLHHARRRWKRVLPDCRLQTLERYVCRRVRDNDLPGSLVPAAYHDFVRTGQTGPLGAILRHNAMDLVTLAQLACRLLATGRAVPSAVPPAKSA